MTKKLKAQEVTIEQELAVITECLEAIFSLKNYKAEMRVVKYIKERMDAESHRKYNEDIDD